MTTTTMKVAGTRKIQRKLQPKKRRSYSKIKKCHRKDVNQQTQEEQEQKQEKIDTACINESVDSIL